MSDLTNKANNAAANDDGKDSVFGYLRDMLAHVPENRDNNKKTYAEIWKDEIEKFKHTASGEAQYVTRELQEHVYFSKGDEERDADLNPHKIVEIPKEKIAEVFWGHSHSTSHSYIPGTVEVLEDTMKRAGLFNDTTGNWELSLARIGLLQKRLDISRSIPAEPSDKTSVKELASYIEDAGDVVDHLAKSIDLKINGGQRPPTAIEAELGLSGVEGDDMHSYREAEQDKLYDRHNKMDSMERKEKREELHALAHKSYEESAKYYYMHLDMMGSSTITQPELGVDPVFDAMFQTVIDAYEETADKVAQAREDLIAKLEAMSDAPKLQAVVAPVETPNGP